MKIGAKFIGTNSLGFESNKSYILDIKQYNSMKIKVSNNINTCIYNSLSAFLRNWNNIKHL